MGKTRCRSRGLTDLFMRWANPVFWGNAGRSPASVEAVIKLLSLSPSARQQAPFPGAERRAPPRVTGGVKAARMSRGEPESKNQKERPGSLTRAAPNPTMKREGQWPAGPRLRPSQEDVGREPTNPFCRIAAYAKSDPKIDFGARTRSATDLPEITAKVSLIPWPVSGRNQRI